MRAEVAGADLVEAGVAVDVGSGLEPSTCTLPQLLPASSGTSAVVTPVTPGSARAPPRDARTAGVTAPDV